MTDNYEERKALYNDLQTLVKAEKEHIFRILKTCGEDYSENSNGIFFNIMNLKQSTVIKMMDFIKLCREQMIEQNERVKEMEELRGDLREDATATTPMPLIHS